MKKPRPTFIHVSQPAIRNNIKTGQRYPVLIVKRGSSNRYAQQADIVDETGRVVVSFIYSPEADGPCPSARVWAQTDLRVVLHGEAAPFRYPKRVPAKEAPKGSPKFATKRIRPKAAVAKMKSSCPLETTNV